MYKKLINNQRGMVLPLVLAVLVVVSILGVTILNVSSTEFKQTIYEDQKAQAHYLARSGAEALGKYIVDNPSAAATIVNQTSADTYLNVGDKGYFNVIATTEEGGTKLAVTATGTVGNVSDTVAVVLQKSTNTPSFPNTLFSNGSVDLSGGGIINGDVGTNSTAAGSVSIDGGAYINGTVYVGPGGNNATVDVPNWMTPPPVIAMPAELNYAAPIFPSYPSFKTNIAISNVPIISSNTTTTIDTEVIYTNDTSLSNVNLNIKGTSIDRTVRFKSFATGGSSQIVIDNKLGGKLSLQFDNNLNITADNKMTINISNGDVEIIANSINIPQGNIIVNRTGTGKLKIYVKDYLTFGGGSSINYTGSIANDSNDVEFYYKNINSRNLDIAGGVKISALLFIEKGDLSMQGGGSIVGNIVYGGTKIDMSGGSKTTVNLVYAPNAVVTASGGGNFYGALVCKQITVSGGAVLNHNNNVIVGGATGEAIGGSTIYKQLLWR